MSSPKTCVKGGFTLIELMIVCVIVGVLASILVAAVGTQVAQTREVSLRKDVRTLRSQIMYYQLQHRNTAPSADQLADALTHKTDESGDAGAAGTLGPYLMSFPANPINGKSGVKAVSAGATLEPDDSTGWLYQIDGSSFKIAPNTTKLDSFGIPLATY